MFSEHGGLDDEYDCGARVLDESLEALTTTIIASPTSGGDGPPFAQSYANSTTTSPSIGFSFRSTFATHFCTELWAFFLVM